VIKEFLAIREDLKKAANKGIESVDFFEDMWFYIWKVICFWV
jgi:hypothetical protein